MRALQRSLDFLVYSERLYRLTPVVAGKEVTGCGIWLLQGQGCQTLDLAGEGILNCNYIWLTKLVG